MSMPISIPPGSEQIAAWARSRGFPFTATPEPAWYRAWEPFFTLVSPAAYFSAVRCTAAQSTVVLVEPWCAVGDAEPLGRTVLAFVSHPQLRHRAAARAGGSHMTRVSFLGESRPQEQQTGDSAWDDLAVTYASSPLEAVRALTPSLRKLLLGWNFQGHIELKPGGLVLHVADALPRPADYERVLGWIPMVLDKALKERP
jgi:hypothetical protein